MSFKVLSKKPITIHEAKEMLAKAVEGMDLESDQLLLRTLDYLSKFSKIDGQTARRIVERLVAEVELTEEEAVEVVNILPGTVEELRTITNGWRKMMKTETLEKILHILAEETGKKS
ncbi:RNA polymerase Rpb4 [Conexivisphaera calida]|uniref:DNA-directed RNA polymerase subunit Rpo4 n=1 Tax=Conexivisphaera calida TaxID=1874277 RepID=A0A4P2VI51_9ARCH|nr:RNA polymerase Rpb4 [Conexivisphaera calida]BBE42862.1 DNA-directed RNA polymerase subunit F [Conexivisphaera calida]